VNVNEVYAGMRPKEETKTEALLQSLDYYEINWEVAKRAGLLKRNCSKKGHTLSLTDTTIAAVALGYNLTLITDNVKHYPMPQLKLYRLP
jgi:predicted nucleic acid-binding protein